MKSKIIKLAFSILICAFAGIIGSLFTSESVQTWYPELIKPALNPPSWVFGVVWPILYLMMGISLYLVWIAKTSQKREPLILFFVQLALNALWSILFFGMQNPLYALLAIIILWIVLLVVIIEFYSINKWASYLLIPYILWGSFATYLNLSIWMLNR